MPPERKMIAPCATSFAPIRANVVSSSVAGSDVQLERALVDVDALILAQLGERCGALHVRRHPDL